MKRLETNLLIYKNFIVATFNTKNEVEGPDNGQRVKHYVYKDPDTRAFWHEKHFLTRIDVEPVHESTMDVSDRRFWGKVRLVRMREIMLPETWQTIAFCVKEIMEKQQHVANGVHTFFTNGVHTFIEYERIKEALCLQFFETCLQIQEEFGEHSKVSYKVIMPRMHIGRERFQKLLDCIGRNWVYFKIEKGYILEVSNIVMSVDWSRRFTYRGYPAYHFVVHRFKTKKEQ